MINVKHDLKLLFGVLFLVLFACLAYSIAKITDIVKPEHVKYALSIMGISALVGGIVGLLMANLKGTHTIQQNIDELKTNSTSFLESVNVLTGFVTHKIGDSLIPLSKLKQIEEDVNDNSDIFILTSALKLEDAELKKTIHRNLSRGVKYKYLVPDDGILPGRMKDLALEWQKECKLSKLKAQSQIKAYTVPEHFVYMTVAIYEALSDDLIVIVKFPTSKQFNKAKYPLMFKVSEEPKEARTLFRRSLIEMIDASKRQCKFTNELDIKFIDLED